MVESIYDLVPENVNDADILGVPAASVGRIAYATTGWDDDGDSTTAHFDQGSSSNDGNTLVKVQLYLGAPPGAKPKPGRAAGHKIVAQVSSLTGWRIPSPGTRVLVAFPEGAENSPGAAVIIAHMEKSPTTQYAADRVVFDYGDTHVVIKGKSVTLMENNDGTNQGPFAFISVGTPYTGSNVRGVRAVNFDGCGWTVESGAVGLFATDGASPPDAKTILQLTASQWQAIQKTASGSSMIQITGDNVTVMPVKTFNAVAGNVILGAPALSGPAFVPVLVGASAPGTPSTSIFAAA